MPPNFSGRMRVLDAHYKTVFKVPFQMAQECLRNELHRFISTAQWPPKSPAANPLDYSAWGVSESKVDKKYQSVDQLKKALRQRVTV